MISYECERCGTALQSPSSMAGKEDTCPACEHVFIVPTPVGRSHWALTLSLAAGFFLMGILATLVITRWLHRTSDEAQEHQAKAHEGGPSNARPQGQGTPLKCDHFQPVAVLRGDSLDLRLETDLPDFTLVMVSVSRAYRKRGDTSATKYPIAYFQERGTVGAWRQPRSLGVADSLFEELLRKRMDTMASLFGEPFEVEGSDIEEAIKVSFTVPVNQDSPDFGDRNINLQGKMVTQHGAIRIVVAELRLPRPLDPKSIHSYASTRAHYASLQVGVAYQVSRETPLMPEFEPSDPLAAIAQMKRLPPSSLILVAEVRNNRDRPWYRVVASEPGGRPLGEGWINSAALIGQELRATSWPKSQ